MFVGHVDLAGDLTAWQSTRALPVPLRSATTYRAAVNSDGTLDEWQTLSTLPVAVAHHEFLNFGRSSTSGAATPPRSRPLKATQSGAEVGDVYLARINLRNGDLTDAGWAATTASENTAGNLLSDGTVEAWGGATGSETIAAELAYSLYNQAAVTFIDAQGNGHVLVLGGARRDAEGTPSAGVIYY